MSDLNAVVQAFAPGGNLGPNQSTIAVTAGTVSGTAALPENPAVGNYGAQASAQLTQQIEIYNAGTAVVFVAFGGSGVVATVPTGTPGAYFIPPGCDKVFTVPLGCTYIATISGSASQLIYVAVGSGT